MSDFGNEPGSWQYYTGARAFSWRQKAKAEVLVTSANINHWIKKDQVDALLCSITELKPSPALQQAAILICLVLCCFCSVFRAQLEIQQNLLTCNECYRYI